MVPFALQVPVVAVSSIVVVELKEAEVTTQDFLAAEAEDTVPLINFF